MPPLFVSVVSVGVRTVIEEEAIGAVVTGIDKATGATLGVLGLGMLKLTTW